MAKHRSQKKRTVSTEQLEKMKEGRERAAKQRERNEMLSELSEQLAEGRRRSENNYVTISRRRGRSRKGRG